MIEKVSEQVNIKLSETDYQIACLEENAAGYKLESEKLEQANDTLKRDFSRS